MTSWPKWKTWQLAAVALGAIVLSGEAVAIAILTTVPNISTDANGASQQLMAASAIVTAIVTGIATATSLVTLVLLGLAAKYAKETVDAAREANTQATRTYLYDTRAWLAVTSPRFVSDLVWTESEGRASVRFEIQNLGRSPATNMDIHSEFVFGPDIDAQLARFAAARAKNAFVQAGYTIFPRETLGWQPSLPISIRELVDGLEKAGLDDVGRQVLWPKMLISVTYRTANDPETSRNTTAMFDIEVAPDSLTGARDLSPQAGTIAQTRLSFRKSLLTDIKAT